jgi:hypothetical protein
MVYCGGETVRIFVEVEVGVGVEEGADLTAAWHLETEPRASLPIKASNNHDSRYPVPRLGAFHDSTKASFFFHNHYRHQTAGEGYTPRPVPHRCYGQAQVGHFV